MNNSFEIVHITNPFRLDERTKEVIPYDGLPLISYVDVKGKVVTVLGRVLKEDELTMYVPRPNEQIAIRPVIQSKGFWRNFLLVAFIALAIAFPFIAPHVALFASWSSATIAAVSGAIAVGGQLLVNAILPPSSSAAAQQTDSPTYSWSGPQLTAQQGIVIPKGYGKFPVSGNIVGSYVTTVNNKQYNHLLIALGHGPAAGISDIKINDNPIENYPGVTIEKRMGYVDDAPITFFSDVINDIPHNQKISFTGGAVTLSGKRNDTQAIEVEVYFPKGLYNSDNTGKLTNLSVAWKIEYSFNGGSFITALTPRITSAVNPAHYWVAVSGDQFSGGSQPPLIYASSANQSDHYEGELYDNSQTDTVYDIDGTSHTQTHIVKAIWMKNPANTDLNDVIPTIPPQLPTNWNTFAKQTTGATQQPMRDTIRIDNLPAGTYDVRITKLGYYKGANSPTSQVYTPGDLDAVGTADEMWLSSIKEISYDTINYNGIIKLAVRALATDQLNGNGINITCVVDHGTPESAGYKNCVAVDRPVVFYRFNETQPQISVSCLDSSGRAHNGTYYSTGTILAQQASLIKKSPAKSTLFNGPGGTYVGLTALTLGTDYTLEMWLKINALPGSWCDLGVPTSGMGWRLYSDGKLSLDWSSTTHKSATVLTIGVIYHIAVSVVSGNVSFIINGVKDANTYAGAPSFILEIVANGMNSYVQAFAAYSPSLRPGRVRAHYLKGISKINVLEDFTGDNPAVAIVDMFVNPTYGAGMDSGELDEQSFLDYANFNNEIVSDGRGNQIYRHIIGCVFDTQGNVWDSISKLGTPTRATFPRVGLKYTAIVDKPTAVTQLFTMANILRKTFKENWLSTQDRSNAINLVFQDEQNNYQRQPIVVEDTNAISNGLDRKDSGQVEAFGFTDESRVWRLGNFLLLSNKYTLRTIEFAAFTEAINCFPGQVFGFSHDIPRWGNSGRFASVSGTSLQLDQEVTLIDDGRTYVLSCRLDSVARFTGTISAIDGNFITLSSYSGTQNVKRLVTPTVDLEIVGYGSSIVEVSDATGLTVGDSYTLYDTDVIETQSVVVPTGGYTGNLLTLTSAFTVDPKGFDLYPESPTVFAFGETLSQFKKFRLVGVDRHSDITFKLTAVEYNDNIYTDSEPKIDPKRSGYSVTGPINFTAAIDAAVIGTRVWNNVTSGLVEDGFVASVANSAANTTETSHMIKLTKCGFRLEPTDVIVGIQYEVRGYAVLGTGGSVTDASNNLLIDGASNGGPSNSLGPWTTVESSRIYGGPDDLCGHAPGFLTPAIVNGDSFGFGIALTLHTNAGQPLTVAAINSVRVTVFVSKAAQAQVTNLVTQENLHKDPVTGNNINTVKFGWKSGLSTYGVRIFVSIDGKPEENVDTVFTNSWSLNVNQGQTVIARFVGFDQRGNAAPHDTAPIITIIVLGTTPNFLKNSSFQGSLSFWDISPRAGDNVSRTNAEDGYLQYNVVGSALTTPVVFMQQTITGFSVGDYALISFYAWCDVVTNGQLSLIFHCDGVGTEFPATYDLASSSPGWKRIYIPAFQVPVGTTGIRAIGFINGTVGGVNPNIAIGKQIRIGHLLVEKSSAGVLIPSTWADIDSQGRILDTFTAGGSGSLIGQASTLPVVVGAITYDKTDTTITPHWTGLKILWPSGAVTNIQDNATGSATTGLTASTTYYAAPYFDIVSHGIIVFVPGNTGGANQFHTTNNNAAIQQQNADGHVPLSIGMVSITTSAVGGSGSGDAGGVGGKGIR